MRSDNFPLPKRCIFCQQRTRLTREDFFPRWFREFYPAPPESGKSRLNAQVSWYEGEPEAGVITRQIGPSKMARPGDLADQTLRVVCAACNNGWMSRLQETAKPNLVPYIVGKWPRPNRATRRTIASWATMFAMVVEFGDEASAVVPPIEREVFSRDLRPPIGTYVWAGRLRGDLPYWFHRRALRLTSGLSDADLVPNCQLTTITLGHLLLQVYLTTSDLEAFDPVERSLKCGLAPLWPLTLKASGHHQLPVRNKRATRDFAYQHIAPLVFPSASTPYQRHDSGLFRGGRD